MIFMLKFTLYFCFSFCILSIPINKMTIFGHLHKLSSPYTSRIFSSVVDTSKDAARDTRKWTKKLFTNSKPQFDNVSTRQASMLKEEELHEDYTSEEKELLLKILREE